MCINCGNTNTKVIDSRLSEDWKTTRRRRECGICWNRFTTYEKIEIINLIVEKTWNRKERYNRNKLEDSILKAVNKRNISILKINDSIRNLELNWANKNTIKSEEIWKNILEKLFKLDYIAYIRYASIHLNFNSKEDFIEFASK